MHFLKNFYAKIGLNNRLFMPVAVALNIDRHRQ